VSRTQLWRYITKADALMAERFDARAGHLMARHLLQRRRLYAHVVEVGDYRTALAVLKDEAELERLYAAEPAPPAGQDGTPLAPAAVGALLSAQLRQVEQAGLPMAERAKLTAALGDALLRAHSAADLEQRIAELERRADEDRRAKR